MNGFAGKTALVTGAASGIGREIARQLAAAGAHVTASDLPGPALERAGEELGVDTVPIDVSSREQIEAGIERVVGRHGRLDLMFNNAGVAIFGEFEIVTLDDWDRIIDVNLRGAAYGSALAYRQMVSQGGGGHIVNTASVAGLVPVALQTHYCATKHAIVGMSKTLAIEAKDHGIGVTVFCPAWVKTGMFVNNTMRGTLEGADPRKLVPIKPVTAEAVVARLLHGVARGRGIVITPFYGRLGWWLERYAPHVAGGLHRLTLRETRRRAAKLSREPS
jgi:NAD(P)-dependent dehydrogenase (short-subunit alcohol dehydrogenase family)